MQQLLIFAAFIAAPEAPGFDAFPCNQQTAPVVSAFGGPCECKFCACGSKCSCIGPACACDRCDFATYADAYGRASKLKAGEALTIYAGVKRPTGSAGLAVPQIPGRSSGVYRLTLDQGEVMIEPVREGSAAVPFGQGRSTTQGTPARSAAGASTSFPGTLPVATRIPVATTGRRGGTENCST